MFFESFINASVVNFENKLVDISEKITTLEETMSDHAKILNQIIELLGLLEVKITKQSIIYK